MWGADTTSAATLGDGQGDGVRHGGPLSSELVEIHAFRHATRFEALEPILQGVRSRLGGVREGPAAGLAIRHDHGSQYMSRDFQNEIALLGPESSPPFLRAPEVRQVFRWTEHRVRAHLATCYAAFALLRSLRSLRPRPSRPRAWTLHQGAPDPASAIPSRMGAGVAGRHDRRRALRLAPSLHPAT